MKKVLYLITLNILLITLGCDKIFEEDLSNKTIEIVMPKDSLISQNLSIQFWWKFDYACTYDLEIVSPSFENPIKVIIDTNLSGNKFNWNFEPGMYQWRIRAANNSSYSNYQYYVFKIDSTMDLSDIQMILLNPINYGFTNSYIHNFNWISIYNANKYFYSLYDKNQNIILFDKEIISNNITIPSSFYSDTLAEGIYKWGVRASNSLTSSNYSYSYFTIDRTIPSQPTLISPINNFQSQDSNIHFKWISGVDLIMSQAFDSLYVYKDSSLTQYKIIKQIGNNIYTDSLGPGDYWWYVKSFDKAGNFNKSAINKLNINQ